MNTKTYHKINVFYTGNKNSKDIYTDEGVITHYAHSNVVSMKQFANDINTVFGFNKK